MTQEGGGTNSQDTSGGVREEWIYVDGKDIITVVRQQDKGSALVSNGIPRSLDRRTGHEKKNN